MTPRTTSARLVQAATAAVLLAGLLQSAAASPAAAAPPPAARSLFARAELPARAAPAVGRQKPKPGNQRPAPAAVKTDSRALEAGTPHFTVAVDGQPATEVDLDRVVRRGPHDVTWIGRTPESGSANVVLTSVDGQVAGRVQLADRTLTIQPAGDGVQTATVLDDEQLDATNDRHVEVPVPAPAGADPAPPGHDHATHDHGNGNATGNGNGNGNGNGAKANAAPPTTAAAAEGPVVVPDGPVTPPVVAAPVIVDVLVVYQQVLVSRFGTGLGARVQGAVDQTNLALANSQVGMQIRLVHHQQVADSEITDINRITASAPVADLRNQYGADLVQGWGAYSGFCGIAWQNMARSSPGYGFSLIDDDCTAGLASAHEWGHNLGAGHDRANQTSAAYPYSFGWISIPGDFGTVMAYNSSACPGGYCSMVPYYSNPDVSYRGFPTGNVDREDNARTLNNLGSMIASYRGAAVPPPSTTTTTTTRPPSTTTTTRPPPTTTTTRAATTTTRPPSSTTTSGGSTTTRASTTTTRAPTTSTSRPPRTGPIVGVAGRCIDVAGGVAVAGARVQLADCAAVAGQQWSIRSDYTVRALGACLDVRAGGTTNGTKAELQPCRPTWSQVWVPLSNGWLYNYVSGRCLEVPDGTSAPGTQLQLWDCAWSAPRQVWRFPA